MIDFIQKNLFIILIFLVTLLLGFLTFLTFIDKSFQKLNDKNLQLLLIINIFFFLFFFVVVFFVAQNFLKNNINVSGSKANIKYIAFISMTICPAISQGSIFSLFLSNFALDKYLDKKIISAVNNSYEIAKNYVEDVKDKIQSDIVLIGFDLNKNESFAK